MSVDLFELGSLNSKNRASSVLLLESIRAEREKTTQRGKRLVAYSNPPSQKPQRRDMLIIKNEPTQKLHRSENKR